MYQYELPQLSGFPSPIGELHFSIIGTMLAKFKVRRGFRPLSGSYISQYISRSRRQWDVTVSVPYRGATFLNTEFSTHQHLGIMFPSPIGELHFSIRGFLPSEDFLYSFRPLSGSYISQYHPRNPMSCLGRIGGLRGKSNFIEIQPFWKVKSSHKSSI